MRDDNRYRYTRTLHRAMELVGGKEQLASALHTSPEVLSEWLSGQLAPPIKAYIAALQLAMPSITQRQNG